MIETLHLFPGERAALLDVLQGLTAEEWDAPTACPGWSVKDVAGHLLGDDVGRLSRGRDGFANPDFAAGLDISTLPGLIAAIDRQNALWVAAMRRVSPPLLIALLRLTGDETFAYFCALDLEAIGAPVDWVGPEPAPVWLDVAREYTERWVHQQHIRDAVGRPGLKESQWFAPVLAAFVLALPRALAGIDAADGSTVRLAIAGETGGVWTARKAPGAWLFAPEAVGDATAEVELDAETAWRLFTRGMSRKGAMRTAQLQGDPRLAEAVFDMVSILA